MDWITKIAPYLRTYFWATIEYKYHELAMPPVISEYFIWHSVENIQTISKKKLTYKKQWCGSALIVLDENWMKKDPEPVRIQVKKKITKSISNNLLKVDKKRIFSNLYLNFRD